MKSNWFLFQQRHLNVRFYQPENPRLESCLRSVVEQIPQSDLESLPENLLVISTCEPVSFVPGNNARNGIIVIDPNCLENTSDTELASAFAEKIATCVLRLPHDRDLTMSEHQPVDELMAKWRFERKFATA